MTPRGSQSPQTTTKSRDRLALAVVPYLAASVIRILAATWRVALVGRPLEDVVPPGSHAIFCFWHDSIISLAGCFRGHPLCVLVSRHRDGELITRTMRRLGFEAVRGSSTRGGAAGFRSLLRVAEDDRVDIALTPDGPRGPRHHCKPGIIQAAKTTGLPLVPVGVASHRFWETRSWDRQRIPKPFAKTAICFEENLLVASSITGDAIDDMCREIERRMERAKARATSALTESAS